MRRTLGQVRDLFSFPNPVNEKAARVVAAGVLLLSLLALLPGLTWLTLPIAVGFCLRVAAGPRFSPLGLLATRLVAPRLGAPKPVPGPPKRFAQAIGATLSTGAAVAWLAFGAAALARVLLGPDRAGRHAGIGVRPLPGLPAVRLVDAGGCHLAGRLPGLP